MKWGLRLVGFVAAGVLVNLGVAWWAAAFMGGMSFAPEPAPRLSDWRRLAADWPQPGSGYRIDTSGGRNAGTSERHTMAVPEAPDPAAPSITTYTLIVTDSGWPWRSFEQSLRQVTVSTPGAPAQATATESGVVDLSAALGAAGIRASGRLPIRPLWRGVLLGSLLYALVLWAIVDGSRAARRGVRRLRGLCIGCGYDLLGNLAEGCPECGWNRPEVAGV